MKSISILSWNIRGIGNKTARLNLRKLIEKHKPVIICIQESKCIDFSDSVKDSIWPLQDHDWMFSPSEGLSGGLILSWNKTLVNIVKGKSSRYWICFKGSISHSGDVFKIINVYAPQESILKRLVWWEIGSLLNSETEEPACVIGDFNCICYQFEGGNCRYKVKDSEDFNKFIHGENLWDVPPKNYEYTWYGPSSKKSKLDRVLLNSSWLLSNNWKLYGDYRRSSDHIPLFLVFDEVNWGPLPFKAFNFWLDIHECYISDSQ